MNSQEGVLCRAQREIFGRWDPKPKRDDRLVACLVCFKCGARTGPNHYELRDSGAVCSVCGERNPLAFLKKLSIREVNATYEIIVCFTRNGTAAHALHIDCKTVLGTWQKFSSAGDAGSGDGLPGRYRRADE